MTDTWLLEVYLGLYTLAWGVGYANPFTDVFQVSPVPHAILAYFPGGELSFGLCVALLGALVLGASFTRTRHDRALSFGALGCFWLLITCAIGIPTHWGAGGLPHFLLASISAWFCWVRLGRAVL